MTDGRTDRKDKITIDSQDRASTAASRGKNQYKNLSYRRDSARCVKRPFEVTQGHPLLCQSTRNMFVPRMLATPLCHVTLHEVILSFARWRDLSAFLQLSLPSAAQNSLVQVPASFFVPLGSISLLGSLIRHFANIGCVYKCHSLIRISAHHYEAKRALVNPWRVVTKTD